jgi:hypothetical protein
MCGGPQISFITSHIIEAVGSGVKYSATIPPQPKDTLVLYTDHHLDS